MNLELIRRIVEEEVVKALSSARATVRVRRPVVAEALVVAAWRRGSKSLSVPPGAIVTPAARERAGSLGVVIEETKTPHASPEARAVIEAVMAKVVAELAARPRGAAPSAAAKVGLRLVTADFIEQCRFNTKVLTIGKKTRVTPLARELARAYGVRIVVEA